ncbi:MAG: GAF domain-containing sensor histidine kinase [Balneolia bacterium]|nr:GAF domain-containing sensor histidine kinase [Balneolia bacterium]
MNRDEWLDFAPFPVLEHEKERVEALKRYERLDSEPEQEESFNRLAQLAAEICDLPIGFINLLTEDKEFKKACYGYDGKTTPKNASFCQFTIAKDEILEVEDAREHPYFKYNPNVNSGLKIVYYIGIPLKTPDGYNIGSLCLIDHKPNKLTKRERRAIKILADEIISQFELNYTRNRLQQNNREKDELIKIVSHDMRNPLMGIIGFSEVLKQETDNDEHREILGIIEDSGEAILGIVNVLLSSEYVKNEAFTINRRQTDVAALTKEVITLMQPFMMLKNQNFTSDLPDSLMWKVDGEKWKQIIGNLLNNACKFTPSGGNVFLTMSTSDDGSMLVLKVSDTGIGMDSELQGRLFGGGGEIRRPGTEGEPSTGIGMTTIQKYVKLHLGNIAVDSAPGKGTMIHISIPN